MLSRALLAVLVLSLSVGCATDDEEAPAGPSGSPAASPVDPAPSPEATPTQTEPEVTPATGPELTFRRLDEVVLTARLPDGAWRLTSDEISRLTTGSGETYLIDGFVTTVSGEADMGAYVKAQKETYAARGQFPERGEDRVVDGVEGVTLEESGKDGLFFQYAAQQGKAVVTLRFDFSKDTSRTRAWIESVLASAEWQ